MELNGSVFTLIGDVVGSRQTADRSLLQQRLGEVLGEMNGVLKPRIPLEPTVGDEFQASFHDVGTAVLGTLMVRLALLRTAGVDSRYGLGVGPVEVFSGGAGSSQDGPGWWTARDAIERARSLAEAPHTAFVRSYFVAFGGIKRYWDGEEAALNAFLLCRDAMVDRMKQPSRNRLYGLLRGWSQSQIAAKEQATQGAISQSLARSGAFAILAAQRRLEEQYR
jgi:hypothetical protein